MAPPNDIPPPADPREHDPSLGTLPSPDASPGSLLIDDNDDTNVKRQQQRAAAMETSKEDRLAQLAKPTALIVASHFSSDSV